MFCQEKKKINSCQLNVVVGKRENYVPWCHWRCPSKGQPAWFGETWWCVPVSPEEVRDPFRSTRRGWQTVVPSKKEKKEALDKLLFILDAVILESNINIREYRFVYIQHQGIQACLCIIRSILQVTQRVPPTCTIIQISRTGVVHVRFRFSQFHHRNLWCENGVWTTNSIGETIQMEQCIEQNVLNIGMERQVLNDECWHWAQSLNQ